MSEKPSILPRAMRFDGDIECDADFVVLGTVVGELVIEGALVVEEGGTVVGPARARTIVIRGTFRGDATARESVRIESSAKLEGDAIAPKVQVQEGARIRGRIEPVHDGAPRVVRAKRAKAVRAFPVAKAPAPTATAATEWSNPGTLPPPPAAPRAEERPLRAAAKRTLVRAEPTLVGAPVADLLAEADSVRAKKRPLPEPIAVPESPREELPTAPQVVVAEMIAVPIAPEAAPVPAPAPAPAPAPIAVAPPAPVRRRPPVPRVPAIRRVEAKRREGVDKS